MAILPAGMLEKIQKLYALSGNNPNEHEAASAAAKCQEMLDKYNLTLDTVLLKDEKVQQKKEIPDYSSKIWVGRLAVVVAREFNCGVFCSTVVDDVFGIPVKTKAVNFYGLPSDLEVVHYTFIYLHRTIVSLLLKEGKQSLSFRENFAHGVITEIGNKLYDARQARANSYTPKENEIMVIKNGLVKRYAEENLRLTYPNRTAQANNDAFSAGKNAGKNISLSQGLKGGNGGRFLN